MLCLLAFFEFGFPMESVSDHAFERTLLQEINDDSPFHDGPAATPWRSGCTKTS